MSSPPARVPETPSRDRGTVATTPRPRTRGRPWTLSSVIAHPRAGARSRYELGDRHSDWAKWTSDDPCSRIAGVAGTSMRKCHRVRISATVRVAPRRSDSRNVAVTRRWTGGVEYVAPRAFRVLAVEPAPFSDLNVGRGATWVWCTDMASGPQSHLRIARGGRACRYG